MKRKLICNTMQNNQKNKKLKNQKKLLMKKKLKCFKENKIFMIMNFDLLL